MSPDRSASPSATLAPSPKYQVIASDAAFAELASGWDALVQAMPRPSPFLLHVWLVEWYRHYGRGSELAIQAAFRGDELVAAFPLVHRSWRGLRVARFLGGEQSSRADLLLDPGQEPSTGAALVERASSSHDFAELFGLSADSRVAQLAAPGQLHLFKRADGPVLELTDDWDALYEAKVSGKRRSGLRRRFRQLEQGGSVDFELLRSADELEAALTEVFRLHALRWAGLPDGSGFATQTGVAFHRAALRMLADQGVVRLMMLRFEGRAIAFALAFALSGRLFGYRTAFDPSFARCSPGLLTLHELLGAASREGLQRVEFLGAADQFKAELADDLEPLHLGLGLAGTPQGRAIVAARTGARRLREVLSHSPVARRAYEGARPLLTRLTRSKNVLKG
jgi:CelD/BcsL family acetyltransferase involved in cellulose biosynthesis